MAKKFKVKPKNKVKVYTVNDFEWDLNSDLGRTINRIIKINRIKKSTIDNKVYDKLQARFFCVFKDSSEGYGNAFEQFTNIYLIANPNNNNALLNNILRQNKGCFTTLCKEKWKHFEKILLHIMPFDDLFELIINKFDIEKSIDISRCDYEEKINHKIQGIIILMELLRKNNITDSKYHNKVKSFVINVTKFILDNAYHESDLDVLTDNNYLNIDNDYTGFINFIYQFMNHFNSYFFDIISHIKSMLKRVYEDENDIDSYWDEMISCFESFPVYNGFQIKSPKVKWFKF